jgi:DnaK suppressor protein
VNKTPARPASRPATAAGKSAAPAKANATPSRKAPAKAATKPATKPAAKPQPKAPAQAPSKKLEPTAAKPVAKAPAKVLAKAPAKPVAPAKASPARPAAKKTLPAPKPVRPPVAAPTAKASSGVAVAPSASVVATPAPAPTRMSSSAKSKASAKAQAAYAAPAPMPIPTSRFADRFAPPRPPTRQMNHLEVDGPKHTQKFDPKLVNAWKAKAGRDLTEAELLAMPEAEYMNEKQLEYFRTTLQKLKDDLLSNADETTEHLREDTSIVPDPADRATIEEEHALELRTRDRERKLLKKITQSLARIESGDYGFCDETGEPIGLGRLLARPTATLSLEAQQRRELKQKMFGD